jgi:ABC-type multidrug transport system permease subunit
LIPRRSLSQAHRSTSPVLAYAVFLRAGVTPDYPAVMLPTMLLVGLAFGLGFSALSVAATDGIPDAEQGLAASLFQTSFLVGGALVLAVVTAVVDAGTGVAAVGAVAALSGQPPGRAFPARPQRHTVRNYE